MNTVSISGCLTPQWLSSERSNYGLGLASCNQAATLASVCLSLAVNALVTRSVCRRRSHPRLQSRHSSATFDSGLCRSLTCTPTVICVARCLGEVHSEAWPAGLALLGARRVIYACPSTVLAAQSPVVLRGANRGLRPPCSLALSSLWPELSCRMSETHDEKLAGRESSPCAEKGHISHEEAANIVHAEDQDADLEPEMHWR